MADQTVALEVKVGGAEKSQSKLSALKAELKQIKGEMLGLDEGSEEFLKLARKAAAAEDELRGVNETLKALDPGAKAQAFASVAQSIVGGFAAAEGAAQLFGLKNDSVAESLKKLQSITLILQGTQALADAQRNFQLARTVALTTLRNALESKNVIISKTAAAVQWVWNAALSANPIGLVVVAVAALTAGIIALIKWQKSAIDVQKELSDQLTAEIELRRRQSDMINARGELEMKLLKSQGATEETLSKKQLAILEQRAKAEAQQYDLAFRLYKAREKIWQSDTDNEDNRKSLAEARAALEAQEFKVQEARANIQIALNERSTKLQNDEKQRLKELQEARQKAHDKYMAQLAARQAANDKIRSLEISLITDERARAEAQLAEQLKLSQREINEQKVSKELKARQLLLIEKKYRQDLAAINDTYNKKAVDALNAAMQAEIKITKERAAAVLTQRNSLIATQIERDQKAGKEILSKQLILLESEYDQKAAAIKGNEDALLLLREEYSIKREALEQEAAQRELERIAQRQAKVSNLIDQGGGIAGNLLKAVESGMQAAANSAQARENDTYNARKKALENSLKEQVVIYGEGSKEAAAVRDQLAKAEESHQANMLKMQQEAAAKSFKIQRAMALAQITVDTAKALSSAVAAAAGNPLNAITAGGAGAVQLISSTAAILANMAAAAALLSQSPPSIDAMAAPGGGASPGKTSDTINSSENRGNFTDSGGVQRVYVVSKDFSDEEALRARLERQAKKKK